MISNKIPIKTLHAAHSKERTAQHACKCTANRAKIKIKFEYSHFIFLPLRTLIN